MNNYKTYKVFDCQYSPGMPQDVKESFFRLTEGHSNDVYVEYYIRDEIFDEEEKSSRRAQDKQKVDNWLIENGATAPLNDDEEGEMVLIKHWW